MSIFHKAIEWMGDHKFLTFLGAAGVGSLVVSKAAGAAMPAPALPGAKPNTQVLPNGGIISPAKVVPPPNPSQSPLQILYVTTRDPAPDGNLNARATSAADNNGPLANNPKIGYWPKNGAVELHDPGSGNGMVFVKGPGIDANGNNVNLEGWAWKPFLTGSQTGPAPVATSDQLPTWLANLGIT